MLQESVDALIDNGRRSKPITGAGGRALKSLSHSLKGKQGRFRQNLLGKRVDYSGRSVIAVGPDLKMYQCGIPREMALNLFKPFVINGLVRDQLATNIKAAERLIDKMDDRIGPIVEEVIQQHPVLLNRAPTLHRLGIQAFEPKLVEGRAIRLHPLVTPAFNADFDGDQMAVHVPLGEEAIQEARQLMLGSNNILGPKDGKPIVTPSQDMVLGNYYLTLEDEGGLGEGTVFADRNEVDHAYFAKTVELHTRVAIKASALKNETFTKAQNDCYLITSVGKILFNDIFDGKFPFINDPSSENLIATPDKYFVPMGTDIKEHIRNQKIIKPLNKKSLGKIIDEVFKHSAMSDTSLMLDKLKDQGFYYSTIAGTTVSVYDIQVPEAKYEIFEKADEKLEQIKKFYNKGKLTESERYQNVIKLWTDVKDEVQEVVRLEFEADDRNPIFIMSDSGARGSLSNFTQLVGMRGLMSNPKGETIELPIKSSFREGLTASEFFISTHGARKGSTDTALKTADSGYLTRRLVDVAQEVIISEEDCGTDRGFVVTELYNNDDKSVIVPLHDRLVGRYSQKDIFHPETKELIIAGGELITEALADEIVNAGITAVEIPGTQLTMRTFHDGGVAGGADITQGLPRIQELFEARNPKAKSIISEIEGEVTNIIDNAGRMEVVITNDLETRSYLAPYGAKIRVNVGDHVNIGAKITKGSIDPKELLSVADVEAVENYIIKEVQKVYRIQGIEISDKHIELIVKQMLRKMKVVEGGETGCLPGTNINVNAFTELNKQVLKDGKHPAVARPVLLGITKASLETESFLSAASFQETTKILTDASIKGKKDHLLGLKENVLIGKLLPAGTGLRGALKSPERLAREAEEAMLASQEDMDDLIDNDDEIEMMEQAG